jgi:cation transport ATPase
MNRTDLKEPEQVKSVGPHIQRASTDHTHNGDDHGNQGATKWWDISIVLLVTAAVGAMWFLQGSSNPYIPAIGVICTVVGGFPIFHEAYEDIVQRRMTMELSMAIAIVAALAIRELFTALVITLFVLIAKFWGVLQLAETAKQFNFWLGYCQVLRLSAEADI